MIEYTQGICEDGAAILKDGIPMTIEEILAELRRAQGLDLLVKNVSVNDFDGIACHDVDGKNWWDARFEIM